MPDAVAADSPMTRLLQLGGELVTGPGEPRRKFDLAHMRALLAALGDPQRQFPSILIAGTNGKGSTAASLASILAAAGYTTGLYTSPHLERVQERIRILDRGRADREIDDPALFENLHRVEQASRALVAKQMLPGAPSFFETMTAIAMLTFASLPGVERPVDIAILEVGLGGRLDATNVVDPILSIITDISMDHMEWLGDSLTLIAREKAGILRTAGTMITLPQHPEVNQALGEVAIALNTRGVNAADYLPTRDATGDAAYTVLLDGEQITIDSPLQGQHQQRNLALALAAVSELRNSGGYNISNEAVEQGIRSTAWPGRLEQVERPGRPSVLLDVAHNPAGAWALRAALSRRSEALHGGPVRRMLIFGCMRDKALGEMAQILFPLFDHVFLLELASPRTAAAPDLISAAQDAGAEYTLCPDVRTAWDAAQNDPSALVVACGSVILVGALRALLL